MENPTIHPDAVYSALSAKPGRSERRNALKRIHEICRQHYKNGLTDFSISSIGKECESAGFLKARVLYNAASADYKALIDAWSVFSTGKNRGGGDTKGGAKSERVTPKSQSNMLSEISDLAVRAQVQDVINDRDRLRVKLNLAEAEKQALLLKIEKQAQLEQTVLKAPRGRPLKNSTEWILKPGDLTALKAAISPGFIKSQQWRFGPQGEILDSRGATIYEPGYQQGIRKLLANLKTVE